MKRDRKREGYTERGNGRGQKKVRVKEGCAAELGRVEGG
jgi:hypothetical protein